MDRIIVGTKFYIVDNETDCASDAPYMLCQVSAEHLSIIHTRRGNRWSNMFKREGQNVSKSELESIINKASTRGNYRIEIIHSTDV